MSEPPVEPFIRRILVALDASSHSLAALEAAVQLAVALHAELHGIFVEDADLLLAADLPFTREIRVFAPAPGAFTSGGMQQQFRIQAAHARQALEQAARRTAVRYTFQVVRGRVALELLAAASEADLLTLGQAGSSTASRQKLGGTTRSVLAQSHGPVLLLRHDLRLGRPVLAVHDGSPLSDRALRLAAQLALREDTGPLTVIVLAATAEEAHDRQHAVTERYSADMEHLHFRPLLLPVVPARLLEVVRQEKGGVLVAAADSTFLQEEHLQHFLATTCCPVLLVR